MYLARATRKRRRDSLGDAAGVNLAVGTVPWYYWLFPPLGISQAVSNYETDNGIAPLTSRLPGASLIDSVTGSSIMTGQPSQAQIQSIVSQGSRDIVNAGGGPADIAQLQQDVNAAVDLSGGTRQTFAQVVAGGFANQDPSTLALWALATIIGGIVLVKSL